MVEFACENPEMEKGIRTLCDRITACGGFVDDRLTIGEKDGNFMVLARPDIDPQDRIIKVPKDHLLPVDKFTLGVEGSDFVLRDHDPSLPKTQVGLMEIMLELYNLAGKIEDHKKVCTWQLRKLDPELLDMVLAARTNPSTDFVSKIDSFKGEEFILESYLKTRVLGVKGDMANLSDAEIRRVLSGKGVKLKSSKVRPSIMPLIDFLNHHSRGGSYMVPHEKEVSFLSVVKGTAVEGSQECLVRYGHHDSLDTLIHYNFVDWYPIFVRSVPLEIEVPGFGKIIIYSVGGIADLKSSQVPDTLKGLGMYLPNITYAKETRTIEIGHLFIPQKNAPRSMRRILAFALTNMGVGKAQEEIMECVDYLQDEIIDRNLAFYDDLAQKLNDRDVKPGTETIVANIWEMIETQRKNINKYPLKDVHTADIQQVLIQS